MTEPATSPGEYLILDFPRIGAHFAADGSVDVEVLGTVQTFGPGLDDHQRDPRAQAMRHIHAVAAGPQLQRAVRVHTTTPDGNQFGLVVRPDGTFYDEAHPEQVQHVDELDPDLDHDLDRGEPTGAAAIVPGFDREPDPQVGESLDPWRQHPGPHDPSRRDHVDDQNTQQWPIAPPPPAVDIPPITDHDPAPARTLPAQRTPQPAAVPASAVPAVAAPTSSSHARPSGVDATSGIDVPAPPTGGGRHSFLQTEIAVAPARQGWRGLLNRLGLRLTPGAAETAWRDDVAAVSEHWPGPRTIAVVNPKGGATKTPSTALLSAVFARYGGAGVLAWDNNETRGTLPWRTQRARHVATVLDLLPQVEQLLSPAAQAAELSHFTHHQPADKYDVLHSDQSVEGDHEVSASDVDRVHQVVTRYYRMTIIDSGNSERAANWRAMLDRADAVVVPCTNTSDTAEGARLMLEALQARGAHSEDLSRKAVAIVSQRDNDREGKTELQRIVTGMRAFAVDVVVIPYDPAMKAGVLHFDALRPATQRAWLRAAAAVARTL